MEDNERRDKIEEKIMNIQNENVDLIDSITIKWIKLDEVRNSQ